MRSLPKILAKTGIQSKKQILPESPLNLIFQCYSTPSRYLFSSYNLAYYHEVSVADGLPSVKNGRMSCPEGPGLGITVNEDKLGKPVFEI